MDALNTANFLSKTAMAGLSAAVGYGVTKTLEGNAEKELGNQEKSQKAWKMAGVAVGGVGLCALIWFIAYRMQKKQNAQLPQLPSAQR